MTETLHKTPLHDLHVAWGARMVDFAGWSLPIMFTGIAEEHLHTRVACSVFDVSHMGRLTLTGGDCEAFLNRVCTRNLTDAEVGRSYYAHICREDGGILDDVIVSRFESHWGIVCNGANREKIIQWLQRHVEASDVRITDETRETAMLAIQGPRAIALAEELTGLDFSGLKRYRFTVHEYFGLRIVVYRSGYTGEDGLEIVFPARAAGMLVPLLLGTPDAPHPEIKPAGLGARDTLRIEAALPLYGHELSESIDSLTAGQGWCVDLSKDFIGADALRLLRSRGSGRTLVGLEFEGKRIAREGSEVLIEDQPVGKITSGTLSPTLQKSIALAYVVSEHAVEGTAFSVRCRDKLLTCRVVGLPFYKRTK